MIATQSSVGPLRTSLALSKWCLLADVRCFANSAHAELIRSLGRLDTSAICDADKQMLQEDETYEEGIRLLSPTLRPICGRTTPSHTMVGFARTVQCTQRNDFLAVLRGLLHSNRLERRSSPSVLMVDAHHSDRAVAGELFCRQALSQQHLVGIVVDGPVRDTAAIRNVLLDRTTTTTTQQFRVYATSVTPYSGTTESPGAIGVPIQCGGVRVHDDDIVVGDDDGIVVANATTFAALLPHAQAIAATEHKIKERMHADGEEVGLKELTNAEEHIAARLAGNDDSSLTFRL